MPELSSVPTVDLLAPIVIAQHLDPRRPSHLADILRRQSALPVRVAEQPTTLEDGLVFVVPPNRNVTIEGHDIKNCRAFRGSDAERRRRRFWLTVRGCLRRHEAGSTYRAEGF